MERFQEWMSAEVLKKLLTVVDQAHQVLPFELCTLNTEKAASVKSLAQGAST